MNVLYILRGVPGSGKSTVAKSLVKEECVCEADQYFIDPCTGEYHFDFRKLGIAHEFCRTKCVELMRKGEPKIVVSNTNTSEKEFAPYVEMAADNGYLVYFLVVENRHGGVNQHGVPDDKITQMKDRIKSSLKL
jgi:predicted kinase